jgi:hypothetical protein
MFFFLLLTLNGFSGKAAEYAVYAYFVWAIMTSLIIGAIAFFGANFLFKKMLHWAWCVMLPVVFSVFVGVGGHFLGIIVAAIVAQEVWKK